MKLIIDTFPAQLGVKEAILCHIAWFYERE